MMRRTRHALLRTAQLACVLWLAAGALMACVERDPSSGAPAPATSTESPPPIDPTLLAFLSRSRAAHHRADAFEEKAQLQRALAELDRIVDGPLPQADQPYVEVGEVLADTRARMADLRSQLGEHDRALRDVEAGLRLASGPTYFRGHLFEVRGLVEERRAKALRESGNDDAAEQARRQALTAFEQAMKIQEEVIRKSAPVENAP